jgi:hypothetical protein
MMDGRTVLEEIPHFRNGILNLLPEKHLLFSESVIRDPEYF